MVRNPFSDGLSVQIDSDTEGFRTGMDGAINKLGDFRAKVGLAGAAVGGLAAGGLAKATSAAADFDASMTESLAIMGDVSSAMRDDMAGAAREVARQTTHSAEEAADSYFYLASAGLDAKESMEAMPQVAEFAQAGMFDMEQATDLLTDSASALGIEMDNLSSLGDRFVKANTLANTSVEQIAQAMTNKAAPAMKRMGVETNEGISALSVFADQGLKGRRAGTILARTLGGLGKQARENSEAFEELGVEVYDGNGEMRDLEDIVAELEGGLEGMSTQQKEAALQQLGFNKRAQQGLDLLIGNSDQLREYESELGNAGGTAGEIADNQLDTFNAQVDLLTSKLTDVGIVIGQQLLSPMTGLLKRVNSLVERFAAWNDETEGLPATLGLVSAAIGGAVTAIVSFTGGVGAAVTTVGALTAGLGAILAPVAAVTAAVAGLATAWQQDFAGIREHTGYLVDKVRGPLTETMHQLRALTVSVTRTFRSAWSDSVSHVESRIGGAVSLIMYLIGERVVSVLNAANAKIVEWRTVWSQNSSAIRRRIQYLIETIGGILARVRSALGPAAAFVRDVFAATWNSAVNGIIDTGRTLRDLVIKIGKRFGLLNEDTSTAAEALGQLLDPFNKVELAVSSVDRAFNTLTSAWDENWASIRTTTLESTAIVGQQFSGLESDSTTSITSITTTIRNRLFNAFAQIRARVAGLRQVWQRDFGQLAASARQTFNLLWQVVNQILVPIFTTIKQTVSRDLGRVNQLVDVHLGDMIAEFSRTLNHILEVIVIPTLQILLQVWNKYGDEIMVVTRLIWDTIGSIVTIALDALATTIRVIMAAIRGDWGEAWDLIKGFLQRTLDEIVSFAKRWGGRFLSWLAGLVGDVIGWFKDLYHTLIGGSIVPEMLSAIMQAFTSFGSDVLGWLSGLVSDFVADVMGLSSDVTSEFTSMTDDAYSTATGFGSDLLGWLSGMASDFLSGVSGLASDVVGEFDDMASDALNAINSVDLYSAGKSMASDLASGIRSKASAAKSAASSLASSVRSRMPGSDAETGPLDDISEAGPAIPDMLTEGMLSQLRDVERTAHDVAEAARPELEAPVPDLAAPVGPRDVPAAGDSYDIDVVIEGDADARDVDRGLSRALESRNIRR